jgi:arylsulfatase A-like enzyme
VPFTAVHLPVKEPDEWVARVPAAVQGELARHYAASVMHLDDAVGQILTALDERGRRGNTLVVFTSDNGGSTAENNDLKYPDDHCPTGKLPGNNKPWRGQKGDLYEGGTRVPALVSWPGRIRPGQVSSPVQIIDWMPTLTALAGWRPERDLKWDGTDLRWLLTEQQPLPDRPLYAVAPGWRARSVRLGNWKLVLHAEKGSQRVELFDLATDPSESKNQAEQQPDRVRRLREIMKDISSCDRDAVAKD